MREIPLSQGKVALVDDADYEAVMAAGPWYALKKRDTWWYARRAVWINGQWIWQGLHTFLTGFELTDHEDGNGLNCQRYNLRKATVAQNTRNQGLKCNNTSGLKGVSWHKRDNRWAVHIYVDGKERHLGSFAGPPPPARAPEEAGRAYDRAALAEFGEFARTNQMLGLLP
jgi:hypothetical protein